MMTSRSSIGSAFSSDCGGLRVEDPRSVARFGLEPRRPPSRGHTLVMPSSPRRVPSVDRPVTHHAKEPGSRVGRNLTLAGELQKRFLNDILGGIAPLPRIKLERGGVLVEKVCEQVVVHEFIVSALPSPLPLNDARQRAPSHFFSKLSARSGRG